MANLNRILFNEGDYDDDLDPTSLTPGDDDDIYDSDDEKI